MNELEYWLRDLILNESHENKSVFLQTTKSIPRKSMSIIVSYIPEKQKTHEERALEMIDNLPGIPVPMRRLPGPVKFYEPAKTMAKWLIKKDPLGLID